MHTREIIDDEMIIINYNCFNFFFPFFICILSPITGVHGFFYSKLKLKKKLLELTGQINLINQNTDRHESRLQYFFGDSVSRLCWIIFGALVRYPLNELVNWIPFLERSFQSHHKSIHKNIENMCEMMK